jgi:hypothetical protein
MRKSLYKVDEGDDGVDGHDFEEGKGRPKTSSC